MEDVIAASFAQKGFIESQKRFYIAHLDADVLDGGLDEDEAIDGDGQHERHRRPREDEPRQRNDVHAPHDAENIYYARIMAH